MLNLNSPDDTEGTRLGGSQGFETHGSGTTTPLWCCGAVVQFGPTPRELQP